MHWLYFWWCHHNIYVIASANSICSLIYQNRLSCSFSSFELKRGKYVLAANKNVCNYKFLFSSCSRYLIRVIKKKFLKKHKKKLCHKEKWMRQMLWRQRSFFLHSRISFNLSTLLTLFCLWSNHRQQRPMHLMMNVFKENSLFESSTKKSVIYV